MKAIYLPVLVASLFANAAFAKVGDLDTPVPAYATVVKTTAQQDQEYATATREHEGKGDRQTHQAPQPI